MRRVGERNTRGELVTPGECPCGKSCAACDAAWDAQLGITGRSSEEYPVNLEKVRRAELDGQDVYHKRLRYGPPIDWGWRPHMPPGSFPVPTTLEESNGKRTRKPYR